MDKNFIEKFLIVAAHGSTPNAAPIFAQSTLSDGIRAKATDPQDAIVPEMK
jgi:hypothetical protein